MFHASCFMNFYENCCDRVGLCRFGVRNLLFGFRSRSSLCGHRYDKKLKNLKKGVIPIYEPGLEDMVMENTKSGRLQFSTDLKECVGDADAIFIAVGTPTSRRGDGYADLTYVYAVAKEVAPYLKGYTVLVDKSTVPVGTAGES